MHITQHRRNSIDLLKNTDTSFGVEIDIRSWKDKLIINHDPFKRGIELVKWLEFYNHRILVLNIKEEGLEKKVIELMNKFKISNFFFLDQSMPFLINTCKSGESRSSIRVSNYEIIENVHNFEGKIDWVWIDIFESIPLKKSDFINLNKLGFKTCLVSPELQGHGQSMLQIVQDFLKKENIYLDAVCTKYPEKWVKNLSDNLLMNR